MVTFKIFKKFAEVSFKLITLVSPIFIYMNIFVFPTILKCVFSYFLNVKKIQLFLRTFCALFNFFTTARITVRKYVK